jgi:MFS family permease
LIADRWGAARTTLLADLIFAVGLGFVMLSDNPLVFLVFYFLLQFGLAVEDSAIPLGCINIVPPERLGAFSSARLMVMSGSGAAGSALFGWLFKMDLNPALIFAMGALLKAASGVWFWYVFSLKKPVNPAAGAAQPPAG